MKANLLLHACCAPCSNACVAALRGEAREPALYWYNPNIHPFTEYKSRRDTLAHYAEEQKLSLVMEDEYGLRSFLSGVYYGGGKPRIAVQSAPSLRPPEAFSAPPRSGPPKADSWRRPARCAFCYRVRLEKTAAAAKEAGYPAFSTTLLASPYQDHERIRLTAEDAAARNGVEFLYRDFRPRFRESQKEALAMGLYMQKYCGCIFSEEERYCP